MARKVNVAIFDNDLKVKLRKYELSEDGTKIRIVSGGENHWMPSFDNDSFLEFPYRAITSLWKVSYKRMYLVKKKGAKCVSFKTDPPTVYTPDPEQLKKAVGAIMLDKIGKTKQETPIISYLTLGAVILILMNVLGMI